MRTEKFNIDTENFILISSTLPLAAVISGVASGYEPYRAALRKLCNHLLSSGNSGFCPGYINFFGFCVLCMCIFHFFFNRKTFAIPIFLPTQKKYSRFRSVRLLKSSLLAMKWNYVNIHIFIFISSFHSSKTLCSTRKDSISFVYLVLQLLLVERTWHGGLSKMTNQKFSSVSKWPTR